MSLAFKLPAILPTPYGCDAAPITSNTTRRSLLGRLSRLRPRNPWRSRRNRLIEVSRVRDDVTDVSHVPKQSAVDPEIACILALNDILAAHVRGDKDAVSRLSKKIEAFGFVVSVTRPWPTAYGEFPGVSG
jgi:ATP-dependent Clp protease ATP-binding subunit ClpA